MADCTERWFVHEDGLEDDPCTCEREANHISVHICGDCHSVFASTGEVVRW
ncbi:hypothetical protein [Curtobacterium sp. MCSS17_016]|uniref:hypothetical protein n=1 Tax=Curtobacterium sp. MCSS17_016 TaxID=2175644 RepID=UPI0015E879F4|nr:hypothetical protein [Curtobacterium sp. MCSS17_016]WIE81416.1 hypothetical protein DEJ19_019465 [Curtobacterium sp. MCSS17_016]